MTGVATRQEPFEQALDKGGFALNGANQSLVSGNLNRSVIEISNASDADLSIDFVGDGAVAGEGTVLPPHSSGYWPTTGPVNVIGLGTGRVAFTEW